MKTYSISEAKATLGAVADEAISGETVVLVRGSQLLEIKKYDPPESIPMRPDGWLDEMYSDPDEIALENSMLTDQFNEVPEA